MGYEDKAKAPAKPQRITMDERSRLTVTGVEEVLSFDEERISMRTVLGELTVTGSGLHVGKLSLDTGELSVEGMVNDLSYSDQPAAGSGAACLDNYGAFSVRTGRPGGVFAPVRGAPWIWL